MSVLAKQPTVHGGGVKGAAPVGVAMAVAVTAAVFFVGFVAIIQKHREIRYPPLDAVFSLNHACFHTF